MTNTLALVTRLTQSGIRPETRPEIRMPWITGFIWDEENLHHIARHGVAPEEVEETLAEAPVVLRGPDGRYLGHGRADSGRLLFIVYARRPRGRIRVITARDMTASEKRWWRRRTGGQR